KITCSTSAIASSWMKNAFSTPSRPRACTHRALVWPSIGPRALSRVALEFPSKRPFEVTVLFPFPNHAAEPRRVVVTGAGILTALGLGWKANAEGFRAGKSAFREVTLFDVSRQRCKIAAQIDLPTQFPKGRLSEKSQRRLTRGSRMLLQAGLEA